MATIQARKSRGHKYWYIVESRRVNGKPRPIVLQYLGKADDLLKRLQGLTNELKLKSYSHGAIAALLKTAATLNISDEINKYICSPRPYFAKKPLRNGLTAGITLMLGAIGRVCMPSSKRGWWNWAKTTSCEYLLRCSLNKVDSQHFWDLMDALPVDKIPLIEKAVLKRVLDIYGISTDSLFFDTTNFFTYIHTTNIRCTIAQRGKNKQKRYDLRQVGLAMVVNREDFIPLFHLTYQGNISDTTVFAQLLDRIKNRLKDLELDISTHTLVFDRGNNSKKNMGIVSESHIHYVGALTPYHHPKLIKDAEGQYQQVCLEEDKTLMVYRDKRTIWNEERTVLVFVSQRLKDGQLRGIYRDIEKRLLRLKQIKDSLSNPRCKKRRFDQLTRLIENAVKGQFMKDLFTWKLRVIANGEHRLNFKLNSKRLSELEDELGFRILMTDRHEWSSKQIISAYYGQSRIEAAFKDLKNPYHLAIRPQFHWTDQKIIVHFFYCVQGYLLAAILLKQVRQKISFTGSMDTLLDILNNVRLGTIIEMSPTCGKKKATYKLEELTSEERAVVQALGIEDYHMKKPRIAGVGVYN